MTRAVPPLGRALGAKFRALTGSNDPAIDSAMLPAVAALDAADRAYRAAIETILPPDSARTLLETMAAFRAAAHSVREAARTELETLYARSGRSYGDFDPLDAFVPSPAGLSHLDGVRAADIADRAKARIDALRGEANGRIAAAASSAPSSTGAIIAAKRARNTAFAGAVHAAIVPLLGGGPVGPTVEAIAGLAEGWY
ncbi:MAG: hypothetical protein NVSMB64_29520 [Candidatus Velthaea sp.]